MVEIQVMYEVYLYSSRDTFLQQAFFFFLQIVLSLSVRTFFSTYVTLMLL